MQLQEATPARDTALECSIRRRVVERTWGRILGLRVDVAGDLVSVSGQAPSYYVKQLALLAVREVSPTVSVELNIDVTGGFVRPPAGFERPTQPR